MGNVEKLGIHSMNVPMAEGVICVETPTISTEIAQNLLPTKLKHTKWRLRKANKMITRGRS